MQILKYILIISAFIQPVLNAQTLLNPLQQISRIEILLHNGQYAEAEKAALAMLKNNPESKMANFYAALCKAGLQKPAESLSYFIKALGANQNLPESSLNNYALYLGKSFNAGNNSIAGKFDCIDNSGFKFNMLEPYTNICLTDDGNSMVFVNATESSNRIFITKKENNIWSEPLEITKQVGSEGNSFPSSISNDGKRIYFSRHDNFSSNIFVSVYDGKVWSGMRKLNSNINSSYFDARAFENENGSILYFSSDRKDGFGGMDLYYSIKVNNDWDKPFNCGARINTFLNDDYPEIINGGKLLIYSSQGKKKGKDGYELYIAQAIADNQWAEPVNAGFPFNSSDDDFAFNPLTAPSRQFFTFLAGPQKLTDSYVNRNCNILTLNGKISALNGLPDEGAVVMVDETGRISQKNIIPNTDGRFSFVVPEGVYSISITYPGFAAFSKLLVVPFIITNDKVNLEVVLDPL